MHRNLHYESDLYFEEIQYAFFCIIQSVKPCDEMSIQVHLNMNCAYTNEHIRTVLEQEYEMFTFVNSSKSSSEMILFWLEYEDIDFDMLYRLNKATDEKKVLANAYCIRKGLLRKANFASFVHKYLAKRPNSLFRDHYPETHILDLAHPDYLDEALNEAFELRDALEENTRRSIEETIPFILKASILDKASELFIFRTQTELESFFTSQLEDDDEKDDIAGVREWVVQRYIDRPLQLSAYQNRKFHLRVYVVAERNLRVYVYDGILALFASLPYQTNNETFDRLRHITNTCAQTETTLTENDLVKEFFALDQIDCQRKTNLFEQIKSLVSEIFAGLHHEITVFQPLKNAFEIYGFDFLIDESNSIFFLEANAYPDFKQTGDRLSVLIRELFSNIIRTIVLPYFGIEQSNSSPPTQRQLHLVYDKQRT